MSFDIGHYLRVNGPTRSATIAEALVKDGMKPDAARKRLSRLTQPVRKFPVQILPKREAFLYLQEDRNTDRFWENLMRDLRASGSVYGAALDGMSARGGVVTEDGFRVVSAATVLPQRGQLTIDTVARTLKAADFIREVQSEEFGKCYSLAPGLRSGFQEAEMRARQIAEGVILDGVREWARRIGLASFNTIAIRGEPTLKPIGPFVYDLGGPSYLLPLQRQAPKPGFLVADVFSDGMLSLSQIQYFIRKARMTRSMLPEAGVLSILVAERFSGEALTAGHAAGIMLATPTDLFGSRTGAAITSLVQTLKNAAAYASSSPDRIARLVQDLADIEGRAGNLRGILFELVAAYLIRRDATSIDMGVVATDPESGKKADIDIQAFTNQMSEVKAIECKGKEPGGVLSLEEVETWLRKIAIMRAHYLNDPRFRESRIRFELWTSGTIHPDALAKLEYEKMRRTRMPIGWKDGQAVLELARGGKEKALTDALYEHFIRHPLTDVAVIAESLGTRVRKSLVPHRPSTGLETAVKRKDPTDDFLALPAPDIWGDADDGQQS